jgi:hypothetical protein
MCSCDVFLLMCDASCDVCSCDVRCVRRWATARATAAAGDREGDSGGPRLDGGGLGLGFLFSFFFVSFFSPCGRLKRSHTKIGFHVRARHPHVKIVIFQTTGCVQAAHPHAKIG